MDVGVTFDREEERIQEQYRLHFDERARVPARETDDRSRFFKIHGPQRLFVCKFGSRPKDSLFIPRGFFMGFRQPALTETTNRSKPSSQRVWRHVSTTLPQD